MAGGGVRARSFVFTASCSGCGGELQAGSHEMPSANVRRVTGRCVDCGNVYRVTVTMIREPGSRQDR